LFLFSFSFSHLHLHCSVHSVLRPLHTHTYRIRSIILLLFLHIYHAAVLIHESPRYDRKQVATYILEIVIR
jgi:hypothetical protein